LVDYNQNESILPFREFKSPFGNKLEKNNRWVNLAILLPWKEFEEVYYSTLVAS
jgi:hypothetical protein